LIVEDIPSWNWFSNIWCEDFDAKSADYINQHILVD